MQGFGEAYSPQPNFIKRHDVRRDNHIDIEAGVLETDRNVCAFDQEPIALPRPATEIELDHHAAFPDGFDAHAAPHPPQQDDGIEFVRPRITESPARSPSAKLVDNRLQVAPGGCQSVFSVLAPRASAPFQHAGLLQPPQPSRKQRAGHVRKTPLKFVEVINVGKQLAHDEHSPTVGKDFRRSRHGTSKRRSAPTFSRHMG